MTEQIIDFLDALVATVGAVDRRYCLVEKRADVNGTNIPYKYKGNGNYEAVNVDGGSVSYWCIVNSISFDAVDGNKAVKNLQATYPIRYVAMVRRDEINPLTFSQDVANVLEGRNKDLQTQLQAKNVNITVGSIDTDTVKIWGEEFSMPLSEPNYTRSMVMIDLTVTVIAARSCWESCDDFPDILQGFDWCDPSTYQRLTPAQITCLEGFLCGACADATVQINGTTVGTIASGATDSFDVTQGGSTVGSWDGSAWIVPPCADATVQNSDGSYSETVASGGTLVLPNITFTDSDGSSSSVPSVQDITATPCTTTPSLSVAVSDDNPDIGDTITITATPTGLSGTVNYYYQARKGTEIVVIGSNTTGTIDWDISLSGEIEIYVEADDGTNGTFNVDGEALTANATVIVTGLELWLDPFRSNISAPTYPDISGNSRDGTLVNSPTVVAGDLTAGNGGYVDFNGTDQYVQSIGGTADFSFIQNTLTFTIMGFVKITDLTTRNLWLGNTATSSEKGFYLYDCKTSGSQVEAIEMQILCGNGSGTIYVISSDNNVISTNDWYHIAITCNSGISQIYVNGLAVNTTVTSNAFTIPTGSSNRTLSMGKVTGFAIYHDGKIAPIQIYNYGLTQTQVQQNFDADKARYWL